MAKRGQIGPDIDTKLLDFVPRSRGSLKSGRHLYYLRVKRRSFSLGLMRRQKAAKKFKTREEKDATFAVAALAVRVFANEEKALAWMRKPNRNFDGRTPFEELQRHGGPDRVTELLHAIDYGIW